MRPDPAAKRDRRSRIGVILAAASVLALFFVSGCGGSDSSSSGDSGASAGESGGTATDTGSGSGDEQSFCATLTKLNDLDAPDPSDLQDFKAYYQKLADLAGSLPQTAPPDLRNQAEALASFVDDVNAQVQAAKSSDEITQIQTQFDTVDSGVTDAGNDLDAYSSDECQAASDSGGTNAS